MLLLFYFLFFTISQTFTDRKQIQFRPSQHYTQQRPLIYRSTHRLNSGLGLNTTGGAV